MLTPAAAGDHEGLILEFKLKTWTNRDKLEAKVERVKTDFIFEIRGCEMRQGYQTG